MIFYVIKMFHQSVSIFKAILSEIAMSSVRILSTRMCQLSLSFLGKGSIREATPSTHLSQPKPFQTVSSPESHKKMKRTWGFFSSCWDSSIFSNRTPGQITSQLSEQKSKSNSVPGEKRGRSNRRDLAWLYFDLPPFAPRAQGLISPQSIGWMAEISNVNRMGHSRWQGRNSDTDCHFLFSSLHSNEMRCGAMTWQL